jgi:hypothetical protein
MSRIKEAPLSDQALLQAVAALAPLPWNTSAQAEFGVLFDAAENPVVIADVWGDAPDHDVFLVTLLIQRAVHEWTERVRAAAPASEAA